jgi:hypothetical protein
MLTRMCSDGLPLKLHQKSAEIEVALGTSGLEALELASITIDSREKTYLLRGLDKDADDVREAVARFKADIASSGGSILLKSRHFRPRRMATLLYSRNWRV